MAMASVLARPAPAAPKAWWVPHPAMNIGANTVFNTTVSTCTTMVGLTIPVPRRAEPTATIANCRARPGRYQYRYEMPAVAAASLAANECTYELVSGYPATRVTTPRIADISTDWLKIRLASA